MEFEIDCIYLFYTGFETVSVVLIDTEMPQLFILYTVEFLCLPSAYCSDRCGPILSHASQFPPQHAIA